MKSHLNSKILVVSNSMPVTPGDSRHAFVTDQAVAMANLGVQVDLAIVRPWLRSLTPGSGWRNPDFDNRPDLLPLNSVIDIPFLALPLRIDLLAWVKAGKLQTRKYRQSLGEKHYDAAIVHGETMGAIFADTFKSIGLPFIFIVHSAGDSKSALNRRGQKVRNTCATKASYIALVGEGLKIPGLIRGKAEVIPNGLTVPN
ncbi:MAG: hypothetical protein HKL80_07360, partial [Acidimicrobiales bacterium]|nr:hypothetical protein [Acidimicrobiales bacterium]